MRAYSEIEQELIAKEVFQSIGRERMEIEEESRSGATELLQTLIELESESKFNVLVRSILGRIPRL